MNIALWIMQVLLAAAFTVAGGMKLFAYAKYKAMSEKNGPSGLNHGLVMLIGLAERAGLIARRRRQEKNSRHTRATCSGFGSAQQYQGSFM